MAQVIGGPPDSNSDYFDPADLMPDRPALKRGPEESLVAFLKRLERERYEPPEGISKFEVDWYGDIWRAAAEPSLYDYAHRSDGPEAEIWRVTVIPSFATETVYRLSVLDGTATLHAIELVAAWASEPGTSAVVRQSREAVDHSLDEEALLELQSLLVPERLKAAKVSDCKSLGRDGTTVLVEYSAAGVYQFVTCWGPYSDFITELCEDLAAIVVWSGPRRGKGVPSWRRYAKD